MYQVSMNQINYIKQFIPHEDTYTFNRNGRCKWLQKICLWVLSKLKCQASKCVVTTECISVDFDNLTEAIEE